MAIDPERKAQVELNANIILRIIGETPRATVKTIFERASQDTRFKISSINSMRKYIKSLRKQGYLECYGIYEHYYKLIIHTPFVYNKKRQKAFFSYVEKARA